VLCNQGVGAPVSAAIIYRCSDYTLGLDLLTSNTAILIFHMRRSRIHRDVSQSEHVRRIGNGCENRSCSRKGAGRWRYRTYVAFLPPNFTSQWLGLAPDWPAFYIDTAGLNLVMAARAIARTHSTRGEKYRFHWFPNTLKWILYTSADDYLATMLSKLEYYHVTPFFSALGVFVIQQFWCYRNNWLRRWLCQKRMYENLDYLKSKHNC
jgi:hypothetical protein